VTIELIGCVHMGKIKGIIELLNKRGIETRDGMNFDEIAATQDFYGIVFPPDLQGILMSFTPVSNGFYDWNDYSPDNVKKIKHRLEWPIYGILFDVEHNNFWWATWGDKPDSMSAKIQTAREHLENAPRLIPVFGHRFISSYPNEAQNPVYSVYQTDIIYYGEDIWDYFKVEFREKKYPDIEWEKIKKIPFWSEVCEWNSLTF